MIEFFIEDSGVNRIIAEINRKKAALIPAILRQTDLASLKLQRRAQQKASGEVLKVQSGNLLRSIEVVPASQDGSTISGTVQAGGGVAYYAKFQEMGTQGPYPIAPKNAQALAFMMGGKQVFAKIVNHPGLPARSFMKSSLDELKPEIVQDLKSVVKQVNDAG